MTLTAEYWRGRYQRAEAARLEALDRVRDLSLKLVNIAADDMQQQVDALEQMVLKRAALVSIDVKDRKLVITLIRRGEIHKIEAYADMSVDVAALRKVLLDD